MFRFVPRGLAILSLVALGTAGVAVGGGGKGNVGPKVSIEEVKKVRTDTKIGFTNLYKELPKVKDTSEVANTKVYKDAVDTTVWKTTSSRARKLTLDEIKFVQNHVDTRLEAIIKAGNLDAGEKLNLNVSERLFFSTRAFK